MIIPSLEDFRRLANQCNLIPLLEEIHFDWETAISAFRKIDDGKTSLIFHDGQTIYSGLPNPFEATRYHSLIIDRKTLPECLKISAWTEEGEIMGLRHRKYKVEGVQFHRESILTPFGSLMIKNFIRSIPM
jgi:anthranilate synthase/aminodeoxychorismate synthase-like glutamine amidotransferase